MSPVTPLVGSDRDWEALPEEVDDTGAELSVRKPNPPATPRATVSTRPECLGTPEAGIPVLLHGPLSEQCFRVLPLIGSRWLARGWGRVLRFNDLRGGTTWQQLKPLSGSA
jgi:hypothetical protein